jgi:hypothetical protein
LYTKDNYKYLYASKFERIVYNLKLKPDA